MNNRKTLAEGAALAAAVAAVAVTYGIMAVHPWPHSALNTFLAMFGRANAAAWPMQIVWYLAAAAMVGLALWPVRRSSQLMPVHRGRHGPEACRPAAAVGSTRHWDPHLHLYRLDREGCGTQRADRDDLRSCPRPKLVDERASDQVVQPASISSGNAVIQ
jgi:hypothetical protein